MLFPSRHSRSRDPLYRWKALALVTGVALFLTGVRLEIPWLNWVGIAVLGVALVLRFVRGTHEKDGTDGTEGRL